MMMMRALALSWFLCAAAEVKLTQDNWDEVTAGKSVFVKFFAPWCGHCKEMAPAWDLLMEKYKHSMTTLVAEVNCMDNAAEALCREKGVTGFPRLLYGDPHWLERYNGRRDFPGLRQFVDTTLVPRCGPSYIDLCDAYEKGMIEKFQAMPRKKLNRVIEKKANALKRLEEGFEKFNDDVQEAYKIAKMKKDEQIQEIRNGDLGLMKAVLVHRKGTSKS